MHRKIWLEEKWIVDTTQIGVYLYVEVDFQKALIFAMFLC